VSRISPNTRLGSSRPEHRAAGEEGVRPLSAADPGKRPRHGVQGPSSLLGSIGRPEATDERPAIRSGSAPPRRTCAARRRSWPGCRWSPRSSRAPSDCRTCRCSWCTRSTGPGWSRQPP